MPAEGEQQLDVVGAPPANARLAPPQLRRLPVCAVEPLSRSGKVAAPECCQSHDREMLRRMQRELLLGEIERASRVLARELELAPVDGDDGDRQVVLRHLEPVLDRDVMSMGGVLGGDVPTPCPELDPREPPERPGAPRLVLLPPFEVLALEEGPGHVSRRSRRESVDDCERCLLHQLLPADRSREVVRRARKIGRRFSIAAQTIRGSPGRRGHAPAA